MCCNGAGMGQPGRSMGTRHESIAHGKVGVADLAGEGVLWAAVPAILCLRRQLPHHYLPRCSPASLCSCIQE